MGVSVPCWGYKLPHFLVLLLHCTSYVLPTGAQPEIKAYYVLLTIMCPQIYFVGSPVLFPRHTQKDELLSGDSSVFCFFFCLSITEAQDNEITHFLFSSWSIHLPRTIFSGHCVDYKFLIKLEGRTQKIH